MTNLLEKIQSAFKNMKIINNLSEYHIKKEYTIFIHRGLIIVKILSTREKKFIAYYTPSDLSVLFDKYGEADVCAKLMKSYYTRLNKKFER